MYWIYLISNVVNGKRYVGFTTNIRHRFNSHLSSSRRSRSRGSIIHKAIHKYGIENFLVEILEFGIHDDEGLKIREPYWIANLLPEYNMTKGGDGALGVMVSEETRSKISLFQKGRKHSKTHIENQRLSHLGHKRNKETKEKMSKSRLRWGSTLSEDHKNNIREGMKLAKPKMSVAKRRIIICPHCSVSGSGPMYRWHFNNCKERVI